MISVLIPTYNEKCYTLVYDVQRQLDIMDTEYEVMVAEDGGRDNVAAISNLKINQLPHCRYIRRKENVGRAAIRNFLVKEAKGEWLLFIDADAKVVSDDFIASYLKAIDDDTKVVVGGLVNPDTMPLPGVSLRYKYEKAAEHRWSAEYRNANPYMHFATFNTMVLKSVMEEVPFNEKCVRYGYEDTLLGIELMQHNIPVKHIYNPLMHLGFDSNKVFLDKTLVALDTLKSLGDVMIPYSHVGKTAIWLRKKHLAGITRLMFSILKPLLKQNLLGGNPNLKVFAFYKLGYFLEKK